MPMGYPESFNEIDRWCEELRRTHVGADLVRALEERIDTESDPERLQILNWFLASEYEAQGNEAAVEAIHRRDPAAEIHRWHQEWQQSQPDTDIIPVLDDRIRREAHRPRHSVPSWRPEFGANRTRRGCTVCDIFWRTRTATAAPMPPRKPSSW